MRCDLIVEYCRKSYCTSRVRYTNGKPVRSATLQNPGDGHLHLWGCHGWKAWVRSTGTQPCSRTCTNFKCFPIRAGVLLHNFALAHCRTPHLVQSSLSAHICSYEFTGAHGSQRGVKRISSHWQFLNSITSVGLIQPGRDGRETVRYQTWDGKSLKCIDIPWEFATEKSSVWIWLHVVTCGCYVFVTSRIFWYFSDISLNPMLQTCINPLLWVLFERNTLSKPSGRIWICKENRSKASWEWALESPAPTVTDHQIRSPKAFSSAGPYT